MSVIYSHEAVLPSLEHIAYVEGESYSGWLSHDKDKMQYRLFGSLSDCLNRVNPIKEWEHNSEYPCFEENVIEWWIDSGWDAP